MAPPSAIGEWLSQRYPKPRVDPEWLEGCYSWIEDTYQLDPATQIDEIIGYVNAQLLSSSFSDSMLPNTGLTPNVNALKKCTMRGPPILLELISLTEIAQSAFSLMNVRQTRIDREDLAGLGAEDEDANADEDEGPVPRYPRGMLKMQFSDGHTTLNAIEYRRIPDLELGVTPLGCKVQIHNIDIRNGIALLEPKNLKILGYQTEDREAQQDADFLLSLKRRLRLPEDNGVQAAPGAPPPGPPPAPPQRMLPTSPMTARTPPVPPAPAVPQPSIRSPLREITPPPEAGPSQVSHVDDKQQPRRRKIPMRQKSPSPPVPTPTQRTISRFFPRESVSLSGTTVRQDSAELAENLRLSPHRESPLVNNSGYETDDWQIAGLSVRPQRAPASSRAAEKQKATDNNKDAGDTDDPMEIPTDAESSDFDYGEFNVGGNSFFEEVDRVEQAALSQYAASQERSEAGTQVKDEQARIAASASRTESVIFLGSSQSTTARDPNSSSTTHNEREETSSRGTNNAVPRMESVVFVGMSQSTAARGSSSTSGPRNRPPPSIRSAASQRATIDLGVIDLIHDNEEDKEKENVPVQSRHVRRRTATRPIAQTGDVIEISD